MTYITQSLSDVLLCTPAYGLGYPEHDSELFPYDTSPSTDDVQLLEASAYLAHHQSRHLQQA